MLRFLGRLLLFLGLLLGLKGLAWWVYQAYRRQVPCDTAYKTAQFDSLRSSYNAVFIGSSRTFMSIVPGQFDSLTHRGLHSYNYGVADCFVPHSFRLAGSLLRRSDVCLRYVLVELSLPSARLPEEPLLFNPVAELSYRARLWRLWSDLMDGSPWDSWLNGYVFALLSPGSCLHHGLPDRLPGLYKSSGSPAPVGESTLPYDFVRSPDGYLRDKRLRPAVWRADTAYLPAIHQSANQAFGGRPTTAPDARYWADVAALLQLAEARHVRLLFYLPNRLERAEAHWLPAVFNHLPIANRLEIRPDCRFDSLFSPANSFNRGHLNHAGARRYTTLLAEAFGRATATADPAQQRKASR